MTIRHDPDNFLGGWDRRVAEGNGLELAELPAFREHLHTETDDPHPHTSWADCAMSWCTWAGCKEAYRDIAVAKAGGQ
jgi:hypothetical protein